MKLNKTLKIMKMIKIVANHEMIKIVTKYEDGQNIVTIMNSLATPTEAPTSSPGSDCTDIFSKESEEVRLEDDHDDNDDVDDAEVRLEDDGDNNDDVDDDEERLEDDHDNNDDVDDDEEGASPNSHKHFFPYMGFCASIWGNVSHHCHHHHHHH